jgi:hypothetical protein
MSSGGACGWRGVHVVGGERSEYLVSSSQQSVIRDLSSVIEVRYWILDSR